MSFGEEKVLTPLSPSSGDSSFRTEEDSVVKAGSSRRALRKDLRAILADGGFFSVMVGIGETYLPAFALAAGLGEVVSGLVSTIPLVAGASLQMASPWAIKKIGSMRAWVVLCGVIQAISFFPLLAGIYWNHISIGLVFFAASLYWAAGMATGPAWNTWVGNIIPVSIRAKFLAWRTRLSQAGLLVGFLIGGFALQYGSQTGRLMGMFAALFLTASGCRMISAGFLATQSEPTRPYREHRRVGLGEFFRRLRYGNDGRLLLYLLAVQTSVQIAGPYFTPYMLRHLKFSYIEYVLLIGAAFAAKIIALPALGNVAKRFGPRRLLWIGGIGIVPLSGCWLISNEYWFLFLLQVIGGAGWAAYELGMFLLFFEAIHEEERTSMLTTFNFGHALGTAAGSLLGGAVLAWGGKAAFFYLVVFGISSTMRLLSLLLLRRIPESHLKPVHMETRTLAIRPSAGTIDRPILSSIQEDEHQPTSSP